MNGRLAVTRTQISNEWFRLFSIMSIESIFGIIGSILTIAAFIGIKCDLISYVRKPPISKIFNELMNKETSDKERRKILKKLNRYPEINKRIKDDYIQNFTLGKRGRESVFLDICNSNDIKPTAALAKEVVGYFMSSLETKEVEKKQGPEGEPSPITVKPIIVNGSEVKPVKSSEEHIVYMSERIKEKYPETCDRLIKILEKHHVRYAFLKGTKDIWCRDYMPVKTKSGKLVQFKYDPSYLKGKEEWENSRSDVIEVCKANGFEPQFSDINLDGGNVLIYDDRAIISDRIFSENPGDDKDELKKKLCELLECEEIIFIPAYAKSYDMTGHADGMVRFVNRNTILGNRRDEESDTWKTKMQRVIDKYGLIYVEVPLVTDIIDKEHPDSAIGIYVNYLEVNNLIVMPIFGKAEDSQAKDVIQKAFPNKVIETIDYNDVAKEGGLLNCTTWVL